MLYAKVVVGLPVDGPFDYSVPPVLAAAVKPGCRVWASFGARKLVGYVVGVSAKASVPKVKPLGGLIDENPALDAGMLEFTRRLSLYFCCSWGEMIESSLPEILRKGKKITIPCAAPEIAPAYPIAPGAAQTMVLADPSGTGRWQVYEEQIRETLAARQSAIAIFSDKKRAWDAHERLRGACRGVPVDFVFRNKPHEADEWLRIKQAAASVVCGTRSSIFSPSQNLGLVIVDEEQDPVHKQEQVPHYHPREAALLRAQVHGCRAVLCSGVVSLEAYRLAQRKKARWLTPAPAVAAEVRVIDMKDIPALNKKQGLVIAQTLLDALAGALARGEKALLFFNRKGFATCAFCRGCGAVMRCRRCSTALTFHFKENLLKCRYCSFSMPAPSICPACNSGYLYYVGAGTEKAESELARLFPQARIRMLDDADSLGQEKADIFVSSESGIRHCRFSFGLVGVLAVDAMLNQVDFRSAERAFGVLTRLRAMCTGQMLIQTNLPGEHCFRALRENDPGIFYASEMAQRKQLQFPPFRHFIEVKLRGPDEQKVKACAGRLEASLKRPDDEGRIKVVSLHPGHPLKLRGNYNWVLLLSVKDPARVAARIKFVLKQTKHSGIIMTVNVDPV